MNFIVSVVKFEYHSSEIELHMTDIEFQYYAIPFPGLLQTNEFHFQCCEI